MRLSLAAFGGILAIVLVRFALMYGALPETVASHFGPSGRPDAWMTKSGFAWFSLIPLCTALVVAIAAPELVARLPVSMVNLPNKDHWLAPERKAETLSALRSWMEWFGVALLAFLAFTYELVFDANASEGGHLANGPFILGLAAFMIFAIVWVVALYRRFRVP
jgi:uncharacterized membrane protein